MKQKMQYFCNVFRKEFAYTKGDEANVLQSKSNTKDGVLSLTPAQVATVVSRLEPGYRSLKRRSQ